MQKSEVITILIAAILLGLIISFPSYLLILISIVYMATILFVNILTKKIVAYNLESNVRVKFWDIYQWGFETSSHFKKPVTMLWLPLLLSLISKGSISWLAMLEFDAKPRVERAAKRHGYYRYKAMTDWHIAIIAASGIIVNLVLALICYPVAGLGQFAKLNIYFALWSLLPLGGLDGSKIFFGSRALWFVLAVMALLFFIASLMIIVV